MDDRTLRESIFSAGGIVEPAHEIDFTHEIDFSQLSVSNSSTVPFERVLSVEAVLDFARAILWPDLGGEQSVEIDDGDAARAARVSGGAGS